MALWLRGGRTKRSGCQAPVPYLTVLETERDLLLTQKRTGSGSETGRDEHDIYRYTSPNFWHALIRAHRCECGSPAAARGHATSSGALHSARGHARVSCGRRQEQLRTAHARSPATTTTERPARILIPVRGGA